LKKLLFSIHDVTPRHFDRLMRIDDILCRAGIGTAYAMLVVPDFWKEWPLDRHDAFRRWLRGKADEGVEMILHGYHHLDDTRPEGLAAKAKARWLTKNEGEFLSLDRKAARNLLLKGRAMLEDALGHPVTGFVAPAWLYSPATLDALAEFGFERAEDHWHVWSPKDGCRLLTSPVVSYASRSPGRIRASLAWSRLAGQALGPLGTVRLALHPHDLDVASLEAEFKRVLHRWLAARRPIRYRELPVRSPADAP
jgi:predicted deacetylase